MGLSLSIVVPETSRISHCFRERGGGDFHNRLSELHLRRLKDSDVPFWEGKMLNLGQFGMGRVEREEGVNETWV
jgi:hypothetical protein